MRKLRYFFGLVLLLKNWPEVLFRFLIKSQEEGFFRFRSGLVMRYRQWVEVEEIIGTFIRRDYGQVPPGAAVVDVGASLGSFTLWAAQQGARVWAFEPAPASFKLLSQNIRLNGRQNQAFPYQKVIGGKSGRRSFFISRFSPLSSLYASRGERITVDGITLKEVLAKLPGKRLDLLKLDCEGAEYEILYRAPQEVLARIGEIRLEYHLLPGKKTNPEALTEFLIRRGFALVYRRADAPTSGLLWFKRLPA